MRAASPEQSVDVLHEMVDQTKTLVAIAQRFRRPWGPPYQDRMIRLSPKRGGNIEAAMAARLGDVKELFRLMRDD
jgi:hypothetical protein